MYLSLTTLESSRPTLPPSLTAVASSGRLGSALLFRVTCSCFQLASVTTGPFVPAASASNSNDRLHSPGQSVSLTTVSNPVSGDPGGSRNLLVREGPGVVIIMATRSGGPIECIDPGPRLSILMLVCDEHARYPSWHRFGAQWASLHQQDCRRYFGRSGRSLRGRARLHPQGRERSNAIWPISMIDPGRTSCPLSTLGPERVSSPMQVDTSMCWCGWSCPAACRAVASGYLLLKGAQMQFPA